MRTEKIVMWVVYTMKLCGKIPRVPAAHHAVCEQGEWEEMERTDPGRHKLIRAGITNEGEAERLARGTSGDGLKSGYAKKVLR